MAPSHRRKALALALAIAALWLPAGPVDAQTTPSSPQPASPDPNALKLRFGIEYWVRTSNTDNFDFDGSQDDNINFGWHRIKPYFGLQKRWFESGRAFPQCAGAESQRHVNLPLTIDPFIPTIVLGSALTARRARLISPGRRDDLPKDTCCW